MDSYEQLLKNNKVWAESTLQRDPESFKRLENVQTPEFLWIGCSDSRVPANEITGTLPGQVFVHRNIANMVVNTDVNLLSVLQYAVEVLKVKHVIVCGHYGCGGVAAALTNKSFGLLDSWLRNIKDVYRLHKDEVDAMPTEAKRMERMVELNVVEQVMDLSKTTIIQKAWAARGGPHLHGWVYSLGDGLIKPVMEMGPGSEMDPVHRYEIEV